MRWLWRQTQRITKNDFNDLSIGPFNSCTMYILHCTYRGFNSIQSVGYAKHSRIVCSVWIWSDSTLNMISIHCLRSQCTFNSLGGATFTFNLIWYLNSRAFDPNYCIEYPSFFMSMSVCTVYSKQSVAEFAKCVSVLIKLLLINHNLHLEAHQVRESDSTFLACFSTIRCISGARMFSPLPLLVVSFYKRLKCMRVCSIINNCVACRCCSVSMRRSLIIFH